jgi:hypothetical protein|tara:strand:- start:1419 stop:1835 length:417 start_codon:yes stop_codon:yes gene_type:complete
MSWERILKSFGNPLLIPRRPLETLRDNLIEPIPTAKFNDRQFMSEIVAGVEITLTLADYYDIPHPFDRNNIEDVFINNELFDEGPLVMQEDMVMIDERLYDIYMQISREYWTGNSNRNRELSTFKRLENKDWDEFMRE